MSRSHPPAGRRCRGGGSWQSVRSPGITLTAVTSSFWPILQIAGAGDGLLGRGGPRRLTVSSGSVFQINSYEKLYEEVSRCENTKVFNGWLQCDCRPFKQVLLNTIKRWSFMFKRHLSNHVISRWVPGRGPSCRHPDLDLGRGEPENRPSWCRWGAPPGQAWG